MKQEDLIDKYVEAHANCRWLDAGELRELLNSFANELLKDAMECEVDWYDGHYLNFSLEQIRDAVDKIGAGVGDKVRVLVLKADED